MNFCLFRCRRKASRFESQKSIDITKCVKPTSQFIIGLILWCISFSDILSDILLAHEYKQFTKKDVKHIKLNGSLNNHSAFLNVPMQWCNYKDPVCHFNSPWYFAMTSEVTEIACCSTGISEHALF